MEVVGTVLSVAQTLFAALQSTELKEAVSIFGYKSELEDLQRTVSTIQAVFQDAEKKQALSAVEMKLIEDLEDAVYEADDLIDEFVTLSQQKQLIKADGSISKKMYSFISHTNPFAVAYKMSKGVKKIKKNLDGIVGNNRFSIVQNPQPITKRRPETCSYVSEVDIIGREEDLEKIVGMLLDPNVQQDPSFLSIVGMGGMGKTALAQLIFNDPRVTSVFPLRFWACVSDQDQKQLDVKETIGKILASMKLDEGTSLVGKQNKLQQELAGKRYLLVLDDVWTEKREEWRCLAQYFVGGQRGSWIVATTRSHETSRIIGGKAGRMHELQSLSEVDSLRLLQRTAFGLDESNPVLEDDLIELGREIVDGCARIPLAIRVVGSLLYCQDKRKWQSVKEIGLANIRKSEDGIMSILQLSYHHLESPLKSCFKYCALFPRNFRMEKEMLIDMWIAQGYVVPFYEGQSVENASEEYFSILLKRCFLQDIWRNDLGEIISCKMHDLIYDIAQSVSRKEIYAAKTYSSKFNENVRHFSISLWDYRESSLEKARVRSYVLLNGDPGNKAMVKNSFVKSLLSSYRYLRALNLGGLEMKSLPDSIGMLLHLRYLDLSYNEHLIVLPKSITKLLNLQTLKLKHCYNLKELSKEFYQLIKLRVLDISDCSKLKMPRGMEKMTCLSRLSDFKVGGEGSFVNWKQWFDRLEELKALNNLKGELKLHIKCPKNANNVMSGTYLEKGSILANTKHLNSISIKFIQEVGSGGRMDGEGSIALMKDIHPHPNLMFLKIEGYNGTRMPDWASLLPNLVKLVLWFCENLEEWSKRIVKGDASSSGNNDEMQSLAYLPQLKSLSISKSPELTWIPICPKLERLHLHRFNGSLVIGKVGCASSHKLKELGINNAAWLNSQPVEAFHCLEKLTIFNDDKVEKLGEVGELLRSCSSSLRFLEIHSCCKLWSVVGGGLEYLTALEDLTLWSCTNLKLSKYEENEGDDARIIPCLPLLPALQTLTLRHLSNLPNWIQFLTTLQTLCIIVCKELKAMPNWMPKLAFLRDLRLEYCSKSLERRCQKDPQGEDWPLIQHIPTITFAHCCDEETW